MIKRILIFLLTTVWLNAGLVNAVAVVVNDTAITMYDIDKIMGQQNLSQNQAVSKLIDNILYEQEIKKLGLVVSDMDLITYIKNLALSNNMSVEDFKVAIQKQEQSYDIFLNKIKQQILKQKLVSKIAGGKLKIANDEDVKMYYENNIQQFRIDKNSIQVIPLEKVKNKIFNVIMSKREQTYLKEYFEALKITADIKIIR